MFDKQVPSAKHLAEIDWTSAALLAAPAIVFPKIDGKDDPFKLIVQMESC